jgi:sigma-B regulation protein RsbU (phosphoserine phosphatase)
MGDNGKAQSAPRPRDGEAGAILVVDDVEANRDALARRLRRRGYDVTEAAGGREALERIADADFDLVLLDIMMPDMNGLEVLQAIRQTRSPIDLPIIMATSRAAGEDVVQALELGANDYVTKPLDFPVVFARVRAQLDLRRATLRALELEARLRRDLAAAARVQASLLPRRPLGMAGVTAAWAYRPCDELAGDALNVFPLDDNHVAAYVLDVSGHGVAAALLAVTVTRLLSPAGGEEALLLAPGGGGGVVPPSEVADRLGALFPFDLDTEQYFTLVYAVLDLRARELRYVSAGHPPPILLPRDRPSQVLQTTGQPVGLGGGYREHAVTLAPGDRVYLYSDGVTDAMSPAREPFGMARLIAALTGGQEGGLAASVAGLEDELRRWCGTSAPHDDISILALEAE